MDYIEVVFLEERPCLGTRPARFSRGVIDDGVKDDRDSRIFHKMLVVLAANVLTN